MDDKNKVFVKTDSSGRITSINSSAFLSETNGWIEIDNGYGDKYRHAHGNYFDKPIMDDRGIKRYRVYPFVDAPAGEIVTSFFKDGEEYLILERTQEEMDSDYMPPVHQPSNDERITVLEKQNALLTEQLAAAKILLGVE